MSTPLILIAAIVAAGVFYIVIPATLPVYLRYRRPRRLRCPDRGTAASVALDAGHAALSNLRHGRVDVRVRDCSLWNDGRECREACARDL